MAIRQRLASRPGSARLAGREFGGVETGVNDLVFVQKARSDEAVLAGVADIAAEADRIHASGSCRLAPLDKAVRC